MTPQQVVKFCEYGNSDFIFGFPTIKMLQVSILVSVRQVVLLFPNLVHFLKVGDSDVIAGSNILKISKKLLHVWIFHHQNAPNSNVGVCPISSSLVP